MKTDYSKRQNPNKGFLERLALIGITTPGQLHKAAKGYLPETFCRGLFIGIEPTVRKANLAAQILSELLEMAGLGDMRTDTQLLWGDEPEWRTQEMEKEKKK